MMSGKLAKTVVEIEHIGNWGSHFGPKELDSYFPHYEAVMSLVTKLVKFCDRSIVWKMAVQFSQAKM